MPGTPEHKRPVRSDTGHGHGQVRVRHESGAVILFDETGWFEPAAGRVRLRFHNTLHWQVRDEYIELAHGRFGPDRGVYLLRLIQAHQRENTGDFAGADLLSPEPHRCGNDRYHAALRLQTDGFDLLWQIEGPGKNQLLMHQYRK